MKLFGKKVVFLKRETTFFHSVFVCHGADRLLQKGL